MNGMQATRIQQNGRMLIKIIAVLVVILSLSGCSWLDGFVGDGRGDWTVDLCRGYAISKINSKEILIIHKDSADETGGSIVISNYFIKSS